ncbi:MAG: hypothetical protein ACKV2T_26865 [Kofleriaceae bacterium]
MRSLLVIAVLAGFAHADPPAQTGAALENDPFATPRPLSRPDAETEAPAFEPAKVELRVVNDPSAVTYRDTFHRRPSHVGAGIGIMVAGFVSIFAIGPVGLAVIGAGFAVTVTAPLDHERTVITPPTTKHRTAARFVTFSGRF